MTGKAKIEWTEQSWNPFAGCSVTSPGCKNCYAMRQSHRVSKCQPQSHHNGLTEVVNGKRVWTGKIHSGTDKQWSAPLRRQKPTLYFVNSMGDVFHPNVPEAWIDRLFAIMALSSQHKFQILTKYPERMRDYLAALRSRWTDEVAPANDGYFVHLDFKGDPAGGIEPLDEEMQTYEDFYNPSVWPLENVWLGVSVEDQTRADERIPILLDTPAAVRFISAEPLLGSVDLKDIKFKIPRFPERDYTLNALDGDVQCRYPNGRHCETWESLNWVIVGGESGHGARLCRGEWISDIVSQCISAQVPVFVKQLGAKFIDEAHGVAGAAVKLLDDCPTVTRLIDPKGGEWDEWPAHYRVRRMPSGVTL